MCIRDRPMLLRTFPGCVTSPSPQGDENGISYSTGCSHAVDTSYPPQGDESLPKRSLPIALRRIRHIPARGRKRHSVQGCLLYTSIGTNMSILHNAEIYWYQYTTFCAKSLLVPIPYYAILNPSISTEYIIGEKQQWLSLIHI